MIKINYKLLLLLSILTCFSHKIYSQHYYLGYHFGFCRNGVKSNGNLIGTSQHNFSTGLTFNYTSVKKLRLGAEVLYEKRGFNVGYTVILKNFDERFITNYHHQNYLSIPLKIGRQAGNKIHGYADIGLVPAFHLKSTFRYPRTDSSFNITGEITENEQLAIRPFDLGALIDFGVGYNLTDKISILSSIRIQNSLFEFSKDYQMSHRAATLFLSFRYKL